MQTQIGARTHKSLLPNHTGDSSATTVHLSSERFIYPMALTQRQVSALLKHLSEGLKSLALVVLETGLSRGELGRLLWSDIDVGNRILRVYHHGNTAFRVVPLSEVACEAFGKMQKYGRGEHVLPDGMLNYFSSTLRRAGGWARIGRMSVGRLRITFQARLAQRGVPIDRIRQLLGFKTFSLRLGQATLSQLKEAVETLNQDQVL